MTEADLSLALQMAASAITIVGMCLGSTTRRGAVAFLSSEVFWFWLTWHDALWGLIPLNIATTVVAVYFMVTPKT